MNPTIKNRIEKINNGEVPEGYEKVSFGIFPCDWEKNKTFGELFDFFGGLGKSREELGDDGVPYLHYGDMHRGSFKKVNYSDYVNLPKYETVIKGNESYLMNDGDIAFLDASEDLEGTSRAVLIDNVKNEPFIAGLHTFVAKEKIKTFSKFYKQYITLPKEVYKQFRELAVGFKVYGLNRNTIKWIKIAYPQEPKEQEKIAEILMTWDEMVETQYSYIKALELRKKALMQKLLTPKEGWKYISLKKVLKERSVFAGKEKEFTHVTLGKFGVVDKTEQYERDFLVASDDKQYKVTKYNDICYNPANLKFGVICINKYGSAIFSPIYVTFEVIDCYIPDFVAAILSSANFINYIRKYEEGSIYERQAVKVRDFIKGKINVPSVDKQQQIADILSTVDEEIQLQKKKLAEIKQQQKSLQQLLLTGIVRVNYV